MELELIYAWGLASCISVALGEGELCRLLDPVFSYHWKSVQGFFWLRRTSPHFNNKPWRRSRTKNNTDMVLTPSQGLARICEVTTVVVTSELFSLILMSSGSSGSRFVTVKNKVNCILEWATFLSYFIGKWNLSLKQNDVTLKWTFCYISHYAVWNCMFLYIHVKCQLSNTFLVSLQSILYPPFQNQSQKSPSKNARLWVPSFAN